jgi:dTDP-4-amino-4,6-dideoxygalactose transaminase
MINLFESRITDCSKIVSDTPPGFGSYVTKFETEFGEVSLKPYNVAFNSATSAADAIFAWYAYNDDIKTVVTPTLGFTSPAAMALKNGHKLVFCDINDDLQMNWNSVIHIEHVGENRLYMPVSYGGVTSSEGNVIDSAHSLTRANGEFTFYSFFHTKPLAALTSGGMVSTNNFEAYEFFKKFRNFGRVNNARYPIPKCPYSVEIPGNRYYMDNINARICLSGLEYEPQNRLLRKAFHQMYESELGRYGRFAKHDSNSTYYLCTFITTRAHELAKELYINNINTTLHYPLLHQQPFYRSQIGDLSLPNAESLVGQIIQLPIHHHLKVEDVQRVIKIVKKFFKKEVDKLSTPGYTENINLKIPV